MICYRDIVARLETLHLLRRVDLHRATQALDLYSGQFPLLQYIHHHQGCTQQELAEGMMVTPASVALSTKRLQKAGLIEKKADQENLRCNRLALTEKGTRLAQQCLEIFDDYDRKLFSGFREEELEQLTSYLDRLYRNVTGEDPDVGPEQHHYRITQLRRQLKESRREGGAVDAE